MYRILLILSSLHTSLSQNDPCESDLPPLPEYFEAYLQYNIKSGFRAMSGCKLSGNCRKLPVEWQGEGAPITGQSISIEEAVANPLRAAYAIAVFENQREGSDVIELIQDKIIWNSQISGVVDFLNHVTVGYPITESFCMTDTRYENGPLDWIFGFNPSCATNHTDCGLPSVASMLHAAGCWKRTAEPNITVLRGVDVVEYMTHWISDDFDIEIKYYWSDITKWASSSGTGKSVPITALMRGEVNAAEEGGLPVTIDIEIDYQSFFEVEPDVSAFYPPQNMFCDGRGMEDSLPHAFPDNYNFGSELVLVHKNFEGKDHKIITGRKEWYDHTFGLSRVDYKPIDLQNTMDPFAGGEGQVKEIMDFNIGLTYTIDKTFGNCSVRKLEPDAFTPGGITVDDNGHIIMMGPMQYFHMDQKFAYNGQFMDRGILMDSYVATFNVDKDDPNKNATVVVYLAASNYINVDVGHGEVWLPMKIIQYPSDKYNDENQWSTYNIHHFSRTSDEFQDFDISSCFEEKEMMRLSVTFPLPSEGNLDAGKTVFLKISTLLIMLTGHVASIRIQQIETLVNEEAGTFDLLFTVVGPPPLDVGSQDFPMEYLTPNKDVKSSLESSVNDGSFVLLFPAANETFQNITAIFSSLKEVDLSKTPEVPGGVDYVAGATSGAMAGLAFGMIFLGALVAGIIYVAFFRNNIRAGLPVLRSFDNPLSGLANIGK